MTCSITPGDWCEIFNPVLHEISDNLAAVAGDQVKFIHVSGPLFELEYAMEYVQSTVLRRNSGIQFLASTDEYATEKYNSQGTLAELTHALPL